MSKIHLGNICSYRNEPISPTAVSRDDYVSTESMLPNKGGIEKASNVPSSGKIKRFCKGDTLVSNIRPYFKKIWHASTDGACSSDVLVFTPSNCESMFLYWVLSEDRFFNYAVNTSKGTKMPRGDRAALLNYQIPCFTSSEQRTICSILHPIQEKLTLNNRLNDYLAA